MAQHCCKERRVAIASGMHSFRASTVAFDITLTVTVLMHVWCSIIMPNFTGWTFTFYGLQIINGSKRILLYHTTIAWWHHFTNNFYIVVH